jgi:hypothetical protein
MTAILAVLGAALLAACVAAIATGAHIQLGAAVLRAARPWLYAAGWTVQRWHLMLRSRFVRVASPDGPPPIPAPGAARYPAASTRDDLTVIHAGGMLLPDRPRDTPEPQPFRVRPYYERYEAEQAGRRWMP